MILKNCAVEGIERVKGTKKADGKPFSFYKLHLTTEFPVYNGEPTGEGTKTLTCIVNDDVFAKDHLALGCMVDIYTRGQYTEYIGESA